MHRSKSSFVCGSSAQWELGVKVAELLGLWGPWQLRVCRNTDCIHRTSYGPIRVLFWVSCSFWSEALFGQSFSIAPPVQALRGLPCLGLFSVVQLFSQIEGSPCLGSYSRSVSQALDGPPSLLFCCLGKERLWLWLHPFHVTQQYHFASVAAQLSSTGTSHHNLFPYSPSIRFSAVNSSPRPGIDPQSL